jgi:GxxExxY protein
MLGRFAREAQYGDFIENELTEKKIRFEREFPVPGTDDRIDFLIANTIVVELKSKRYILKTDYYQAQRYLHLINLKLCLLVNFQNRHLKPIRIVKNEKETGRVS